MGRSPTAKGWVCITCGKIFGDDEEDARTHELSTGNPDGKKHIITYR